MRGMSVVKINAIEVPAEQADELARRFAARAGEVEHSDGFEEFQLLRPTDDRTTWLVYTRWRDEAAFNAWMESRAFGKAHGHGVQATQAGEGQPPRPPVGTGSELWSFQVEQHQTASG
jgi:heme-degrading monooxygenase HmoA